MGDRHRIEERPLAWAGAGGSSASRLNLTDLVAGDTITAGAAATLRLLARARTSLLVIGGPSGCGKTTLLEALLPFYPLTDRRFRLRGVGESFDWARRSGFDPAASVIVAEEISGHLPSYLWGPAVGTFLGWGKRGATLVATAHAEDPAEVVALLCGYPLRLPIGSVAGFDIVVRMGAGSRSPRLDAAWAPTVTAGGGVIFEPVTLERSIHGLPAGLQRRLDLHEGAASNR